MPLCKQCEKLGERSGTSTYEETTLDKGEQCDRCGKTSYEEANEPEDHEHDWRPDGDSWTTRTCDCDFKRGIDRAAHIGKHPDHYERKRRYTCHCGKSKTVRLKESGGKK